MFKLVRMGDASVLSPLIRHPHFTWVGYLREGNGVPVGAGEVWMESGDACVALARGSRRSRDEDEGDASVPTAPHPNPRPYGDEGT